MSSTYRVLCISHDPAIIVESIELQSGADGRLVLEGLLAARPRDERLEQHRHCELLGGRYSSPLVEVCCPPRDTHPHSGHWIDAEWLRLLAAAYVARSHPSIAEALKKIGRCWSEERVLRLRAELGVGHWYDQVDTR